MHLPSSALGTQWGRKPEAPLGRGAGQPSRVHAICTIAAAALLVSCSEPVPFHADVRFTPDEREEIRQGAAFLSVHTGRAIDVVFDLEDAECRDGHILRVETVGGQSNHFCTWLGKPWARVPLSALAAHEFAHWFNILHVDRPGSLMYSPQPSLAWTPEDEAECRRAGVCGED